MALSRKEIKKRFKERHPERFKEQQRRQNERKYKKHRRKILDVNAQNKAANRDKWSSCDKKYAREYQRQRRKDPVHRLHDTCRARIHAFLKSKNVRKNTKTEKLIGCSMIELQKYLGAVGSHQHIDHIFPLRLYKKMSVEEQQKAMNYRNLQVLLIGENLDKHDQLPTKAMASKVPKELWPDGVTQDMLPDVYEGWTDALHK